MKIAIMQPTFNPWLGYFDLIDYVDSFVFLDTVQLNHQSWQTRNRLKVQGKELMFSLPIVKERSKRELLIKDARLDFRRFDFRKKLARTLEQNYKKADAFEEVHPFVMELVHYDTERLSEYNIHITAQIASRIGIDTPRVILSQSGFSSQATKGELVLDICLAFGGDTYVSPLGAKEYLETSRKSFEAKGVAIGYQHYAHPRYPQVGEDFLPYMGVFDLLYNVGFERARDIILEGRHYEDR